MLNFLRSLKAARWTEYLLFIIFAAVLILLVLPDDVQKNPSNISAEELRLAQILSSIDGAGDVSVMLYSDTANKGAVVVSEGAGSLLTRLELIKAVHMLTGISVENIEVYRSSA